MKASRLTELTNNLKLCPYCDSTAVLENIERGKTWRVRCKNFECGGTHWAQPEPEAACEIWNRRKS